MASLVNGSLAASDSSAASVFPLFVLIFLVSLGLVAWGIERARAQRTWRAKNEREYEQAAMLSGEIQEIMSQPHPMTLPSTGYRTATGLHLGEVERHFDSSITASITGWLEHDLAFRGWGVGVAGQHVGVGTGRLGLVGQSSVQLDLRGVARDDLLADGFVAVLERRDVGSIDTLRVVVPSQPMIREIIGALLDSLGATFGHGSYTASVLTAAGETARAGLTTDVSHVSDVLTAILRLPETVRPTVSVIGARLTEFAILGGAIRVGNEDRTYQLFPFELAAALTSQVTNNPALANQFASPGPAEPRLGL
jgi:hypothetical protein